MFKRAQLSILIILVVLVAVVMWMFWFRPVLISKEAVPVPSEAGIVREFVRTCFLKSSREAVSWFYANDLNRVLVPLEEPGDKIVWWPVWYDRGTVNLPIDVSGWVEDYAEGSQKRCSEGLKALPVSVSGSGVKVLADIGDNGVVLTMRQPLIVKGVSGQTLLSDAYAERINLRLKTMLGTASGIIDRIALEPDNILIEYIIDRSIRNQLKITYAYPIIFGETDRRIVVYRIEDMLADNTVDYRYIKFIARME